MSLKSGQKNKTSIGIRYITSSFRILPSFLIPGFPRCGTTSLFNYLIAHPSVIPPLKKEIRFFSQQYHSGLKWYRLFFPTSLAKFKINKKFRHNFMTGEASATYVHHPLTPIRIKKLIPSIKIIFLLRNPVDRAFSQYHHIKKQDRESLSFDKAIQVEFDRIKNEWEKMSKEENYYSMDYHNYSYLSAGIYVDILKKWYEVFSEKQILVIRSEDLYSEPKKIFKNTIKFLGLQPFELETFEKFNYYSDKPSISSSTRNKLYEFFKPHNERLYKFLGRNMHWEDELK